MRGLGGFGWTSPRREEKVLSPILSAGADIFISNILFARVLAPPLCEISDWGSLFHSWAGRALTLPPSGRYAISHRERRYAPAVEWGLK